VLLKSDNDVLTLTNYRVLFDERGNGGSKYVGISLESVSSCGLVTRSRPLLLGLASIAGLLVFVQHGPTVLALLLIALAFVAAHFLTKSGVITVSSNGGEGIVVRAKGMDRERIHGFLDAVVEANSSSSEKHVLRQYRTSCARFCRTDASATGDDESWR